MPITSEITTYRQLFDERYAELKALLTDLPAAALLWKPFEQSPWQGPCSPLGLIIAHTVSSTVYLLRRAEYTMGKCAWAEVDGDEGSEEFGPATHAPAYLLARVERTQAYVHQFLDRLAEGDLDQSRAHPRRANRSFNARYDVVHAVDHMSQHIGHGQITRQLWALAN